MTEPTPRTADNKIRAVIDRLDELEAVFDHFNLPEHQGGCRDAAEVLRDALEDIHFVRRTS